MIVAAQYVTVTDEVELKPDEFVDACRGKSLERSKVSGDPSREVILPVLRVPRRYLGNKQSLLLLPGYEKRTSSNEVWQDLMRQALVGAAGCVIVTDSTRLATQGQQAIVKDMLANEFRTVKPLIVIAKTETFGGNEESVSARRSRSSRRCPPSRRWSNTTSASPAVRHGRKYRNWEVWHSSSVPRTSCCSAHPVFRTSCVSRTRDPVRGGGASHPIP
jgi:hypothetical protein